MARRVHSAVVPAIESSMQYRGYVPILLLVSIGLMHIRAYYPFIVDDAFISFRYAENLAQGYGLVFNPGEYVEGYTNFLWVVLLAMFHRFGIDTVFAARVLGGISGLLTIWFLIRITHLVVPTPRFGWNSSLAAFLVALYPGFAIWSTAGLETPLFTFLLVVCIWFFVQWVQGASFNAGVRFSFTAVLLSLVRPEGPLFFGIGLIAITAFKWLQSHSVGKAIRTIYFPSLVFSILVGGYYLWRWQYYGYWLPNTFYLKVPRTSRIAISQGYWYISGFWSTIGGWWLFWSPLVLLVTRRRAAWIWCCWLWLTAWLYYIHRVNGDWMPYYRFFIPVIPVLYLLVQEMLRDIHGACSTSKLPPTRSIGLVLSGILLGYSLLNAAYVWRTQHDELYRSGVAYRDAGLWLRQHVEKDKVIALADAGAIPYYSRLRVIDYYGLVNARVAHSAPRWYQIDQGKGSTKQYLLRLDVNWLLDQEVDLIELPGQLVDGRLVTHLEQAALIWHSDRFQKEYSNLVYNRNGILIFARVAQ